MSQAQLPVNCDRSRVQIALGLDREVSQFERAILTAHLAACADCRRFQEEVTAFTRVLRDAPLERLEHPIVVERGRSAWSSLRVPSAAVAMIALAVIGLTSMSPVRHKTTVVRADRIDTPTDFPTGGEIEQEIAFLDLVSGARNVAYSSNIR